jgi:hypothetical protein
LRHHVITAFSLLAWRPWQLRGQWQRHRLLVQQGRRRGLPHRRVLRLERHLQQVQERPQALEQQRELLLFCHRRSGQWQQTGQR